VERFHFTKEKHQNYGGAQPRTSCRSLFQQLEILLVSYQYILSLKSFIINNQKIFQTIIYTQYKYKE